MEKRKYLLLRKTESPPYLSLGYALHMIEVGGLFRSNLIEAFLVCKKDAILLLESHCKTYSGHNRQETASFLVVFSIFCHKMSNEKKQA